MVVVLSLACTALSVSASLRDWLVFNVSAIAGIEAIPAMTLPKSTQPHAEQFLVFDGTKYSKKPDFISYGILPNRIVYAQELWRGPEGYQKLPDPVRIRDVARHLDPGTPITIDIEHWPLKGQDGTVKSSLDKYLQVVTWFREYAPGIKLGYYGHPPITDYWRAIDGRGKLESQGWKVENSRIQAMADAVDILYPSLYTFYQDRNGWVKYATAQLTEAKRLAKGKPVYAFLWPQFHNSNRFLGCQFVSADYWKLQLETAKKLADGVVIWGGWHVCDPKGGPMEWDEKAEWWRVTKDFIKTLR